MNTTNKPLYELSPEEKREVLIRRLATYLEYRKGAEENKEDVDNLKSLIKDTLEDIKADIEGVCDPFEHLKQEPNTTREEWDRATEGHKKYFEEQYEQLKTWYREKTKETVGNDWNLIGPNNEPTKTELILDEEIINMAKGFMVGPVGLYNGRAVAAETHRYPNLTEMQIFLKVQAKTQDMVMYMTIKKDNAYYFRGTFAARE